jgi:hypothetical protein
LADCGSLKDAEFMAASREDVPALVAEVERLAVLVCGAGEG